MNLINDNVEDNKLNNKEFSTENTSGNTSKKNVNQVLASDSKNTVNATDDKNSGNNTADNADKKNNSTERAGETVKQNNNANTSRKRYSFVSLDEERETTQTKIETEKVENTATVQVEKVSSDSKDKQATVSEEHSSDDEGAQQEKKQNGDKSFKRGYKANLSRKRVKTLHKKPSKSDEIKNDEAVSDEVEHVADTLPLEFTSEAKSVEVGVGSTVDTSTTEQEPIEPATEAKPERQERHRRFDRNDNRERRQHHNKQRQKPESAEIQPDEAKVAAEWDSIDTSVDDIPVFGHSVKDESELLAKAAVETVDVVSEQVAEVSVPSEEENSRQEPKAEQSYENRQRNDRDNQRRQDNRQQNQNQNQNRPQKQQRPQQEGQKRPVNPNQGSPNQRQNGEQNGGQQRVNQNNDDRNRNRLPQQQQNGQHQLRLNNNQRLNTEPQTQQPTQQPRIHSQFKMISIVIPLYDEAQSLSMLASSIKDVMRNLRVNWEVIFVDDGSKDNSLQLIRNICRSDQHFRYISFQKNYGKSAALQTGFKHVHGDVVITMDADLQDDPAEIPNLLKKLETTDLVSGWKKKRYDPFIKKYTSRFFNKVTSLMSGIKIHDFNCGLKAYRRKVVDNIQLYGEMHRYVPVLAKWKGFSVSEIPVRHQPRKYGVTKFGASRFFKGFVDLLTVTFLTRYLQRPMHLFGFMGALSFFTGFGIDLYIAVEKIWHNQPVGQRPILFLGVLLMILGVQLFSTGLLGELMVHNFQTGKEYSIKEKNVQ